MEALNPLQYPIGKFSAPDVISPELRATWIETIERFPGELADLVSGASKENMSKAYRPGSWSARQVVHHMFDSHMIVTSASKWP